MASQPAETERTPTRWDVGIGLACALVAAVVAVSLLAVRDAFGLRPRTPHIRPVR